MPFWGAPFFKVLGALVGAPFLKVLSTLLGAPFFKGAEYPFGGLFL